MLVGVEQAAAGGSWVAGCGGSARCRGAGAVWARERSVKSRRRTVEMTAQDLVPWILTAAFRASSSSICHVPRPMMRPGCGGGIALSGRGLAVGLGQARRGELRSESKSSSTRGLASRSSRDGLVLRHAPGAVCSGYVDQLALDPEWRVPRCTRGVYAEHASKRLRCTARSATVFRSIIAHHRFRSPVSTHA